VTGAVVAVCAGAGLLVGLGLEVVVDRVPRREPLNGWSRRDLNPGRAALLAALTVALFVGLAIRYDESWVLPAFLVLTAGLVALSVIDLEHFLLPNRIVYPLAVGTLALLALAAVGDDAWAAFGRAVLGGVAATVTLGALHLVSPRSMGFGDVKLAFVLGLALGWLGWGEFISGLYGGFFLGAIVGIALIAAKVMTRKQMVPFGPFMLIGALAGVALGGPLARLYVG
jgi:leader peptidase (prepilin peptidase) / N-methyltransferase